MPLQNQTSPRGSGPGKNPADPLFYFFHPLLPPKNAPSGIYPERVVVDHGNSTESVDALSPKWVLEFRFLPFLNCDNIGSAHKGLDGGAIESEKEVNVDARTDDESSSHTDANSPSFISSEVVSYINEDLVLLLRLRHHLFWSQVVYNASFQTFIGRLFHHFKRLVPFRALPDVYQDLLKSVLLVVIRVSMQVESPEQGFGSSEYHAELVHDSILDLPNLMDFTSVYADLNTEVVGVVLSRLFSAHERYRQSASRALSLANDVMNSLARKLDEEIRKCLNQPAKKNGDGSRSHVEPEKQKSRTASILDNNSVLSLFEYTSSYFQDITSNLDCLFKLVPELLVWLPYEDALIALEHYVGAFRFLLPNLTLPIDIHLRGSYYARHNANRRRILSCIHQVLMALLRSIEEDARLPPNSSGELHRTSVQLVYAKMDRLLSLVTDKTSAVQRCSQRPVPPSEAPIETKTEVIGFGENDSFSFTTSDSPSSIHLYESLKECSVHFDLFLHCLEQSHCSVSTLSSSFMRLLDECRRRPPLSPDAEVNNYLHSLEAGACLLAEIAEASSDSVLARLLQSDRADSISDQRWAANSSNKNDHQSPDKVELDACIRIALSKGRALTDPDGSAIRNISSQVKQVCDVFSNLSEGFVLYALISYYKSDSSQLIADILDDRLPPELNRVSKSLSLSRLAAAMESGAPLSGNSHSSEFFPSASRNPASDSRRVAQQLSEATLALHEQQQLRDALDASLEISSSDGASLSSRPPSSPLPAPNTNRLRYQELIGKKGPDNWTLIYEDEPDDSMESEWKDANISKDLDLDTRVGAPPEQGTARHKAFTREKRKK